jgi:hypothetical protein
MVLHRASPFIGTTGINAGQTVDVTATVAAGAVRSKLGKPSCDPVIQ